MRVETIKDFDEPMSTNVRHRIAALKPGYYTRMGAALRHATAKLAERPNRKHLLLVLTDGKPNDVDHYEAVSLLKIPVGLLPRRVDAASMSSRSLSIRMPRSMCPPFFGHHGYAVVPDIRRLPAVLPQIYRALVR